MTSCEESLYTESYSSMKLWFLNWENQEGENSGVLYIVEILWPSIRRQFKKKKKKKKKTVFT